MAWMAALSNGGMPEHADDLRVGDRAVGHDVEAHGQASLPAQARELRDLPVELDAPDHLGGIGAPVVPLRVEGDRTRVDEASVGIGRRRSALASGHGAAGRVLDGLAEVGELSDLAGAGLALARVGREFGGLRVGSLLGNLGLVGRLVSAGRLRRCLLRRTVRARAAGDPGSPGPGGQPLDPVGLRNERACRTSASTDLRRRRAGRRRRAAPVSDSRAWAPGRRG